MIKPIKNTLSLCFILVILLSALLTGCCDSGNTSANSGTEGKIVLEFWNTMEGREAAVMPDVLIAFHEKYPDITVKETSVDFYGAREKFIKEASEGEGPDLIRTDRFWLPRFVNKGLLSEIKENEITEEIADMVPVAREFVTVDKKIWAIPISVDSLAMFYN